MNVTELLEEKGYKIDQFTAEEKQTYYKMLESVQNSQMTPEKLRTYIVSMREAVEKELVNEPTFIRVFLWKVENPKLIKLQARLQNYILLESFLLSPERAKEELEAMIGSLNELKT